MRYMVKQVEMTLHPEAMVAGKSCTEEGCSSHCEGPNGEFSADDVKRV
jgi:hypothetical protein